jgi:hypothetical protein
MIGSRQARKNPPNGSRELAFSPYVVNLSAARTSNKGIKVEAEELIEQPKPNNGCL